ncbi:MAG: outer membrane protein assembly factor BamB [Planctomycetota bacterium]|jgi:outer membrane protein assembly factor BamB
MRIAQFCLPTLFLCLLVTDDASGRDWRNWRGPNHDGSVTATGLPTSFDQEQGVRWMTELPGPGASTPIVVGDQIFLTVVEPEAGELLAICIDRTDGSVVWEAQVGSGYRPAGKGEATSLHNRSNYASCSAVSDGERVVFLFGNADMAAFDLEGKRLWSRNLQKDLGDFCFQWTFSASPTLWEGKLFLPVLQRNESVGGIGETGEPSYLLALDPKTGKTLYQVERPSDANKESLESYATATPYIGPDGRKALLIVGGDIVSGHDPETGRELWRWGTWNEGHREQWWRVVPSVVVGGGHALVCAPKRAPAYAVKLGGSGTLDPSGVAWKSEGARNPVSSDVPTPLYYDGDFFVLSDVREALSRVDAETGVVEWTLDMPGKEPWRASPTGADGKVYCMNHTGHVVVVDAAKGTILHEAQMGEEDAARVRASIVVSDGCLFIRTALRLYCIGGAK